MDPKNVGPRRFPAGLGGALRRSMYLDGDKPPAPPEPVALLDVERVEITDDDSATKVILDGRKAFNDLAKRFNKDTVRWAEKEREFEERLRAAKAKEDDFDARLKALSRSTPEWKLEDGSLQHVARRLVAPPGIERAYYNATVLKPEEMRHLANLDDAKASAIDPYARTWARKFKVTEELRYLIEEFQSIGDTLILEDILRAGRGDASAYGQIGPRSVRMKTLPLWQDWQKISKDVARAMHTQTASPGQGIDWVPTLMSSNLKLLIQAATQVAALFQEITMPSATYDNPVEGADPVIYLIGEATADNESTNVITADTPKTAKMTLVAKKLALRILLSSEIFEDSIISVASDVLRRFAKVFARGIEQIIMDGDTAGTHQDSDTQALGAKDRRKAWDGLRKHALISNMPNVNLNTFTTANLLSIRKAMGIYGSQPSELAWIVGFKGMIEMMKLPEVITMEKYGINASVVAGEVARFFGSPVVLSEFVREDLTANAIYDGVTTTFTYLLCVNREAFAHGERRILTINSSNDRHIETDQTVVVGTMRRDFKPWFPTAAAANKIVGIGRNFS